MFTNRSVICHCFKVSPWAQGWFQKYINRRILSCSYSSPTALFMLLIHFKNFICLFRYCLVLIHWCRMYVFMSQVLILSFISFWIKNTWKSIQQFHQEKCFQPEFYPPCLFFPKLSIKTCGRKTRILHQWINIEQDLKRQIKFWRWINNRAKAVGIWWIWKPQLLIKIL